MESGWTRLKARSRPACCPDCPCKSGSLRGWAPDYGGAWKPGNSRCPSETLLLRIHRLLAVERRTTISRLGSLSPIGPPSGERAAVTGQPLALGQASPLGLGHPLIPTFSPK